MEPIDSVTKAGEKVADAGTLRRWIVRKDRPARVSAASRLKIEII